VNPYIARVIDRTPEGAQQIWNMTEDEARERILSGDPDAVLGIEGSFALWAQDGRRVCLARSLDRPLRYFLAKEVAGPALIVAERIDQIYEALVELGYQDQFHPTYTRMVPAHLVTTLQLLGCPDPSPEYTRFFAPPRATIETTDLNEIGEAYIGALHAESRRWLDAQDGAEPVGVLFSGGVDSGAVLLSLNRALLERGEAPQRLKAFTLSLGGRGADVKQAHEFLGAVGMEMLLEVFEAPDDAADALEAVQVIEDYKPLDVQCAAVNLALLKEIRSRYPDWKLLADGDGGDENLKDYPIEENSELTIRSVVNNSMLYQEGWGHDSLKHSLVHTGGYSRACVRTSAPLRHLGFRGFSPYTRPSVISVAESIPFHELTQGSHDRLYALKGDIVRRGVKSVLGYDMPVFEKRRFQHGVSSMEAHPWLYSDQEGLYRSHFLSLHLPTTRPASPPDPG
jgi:asparagine synthase (glutamine-hydrolysing)